jgi:hypothetical protein
MVVARMVASLTALVLAAGTVAGCGTVRHPAGNTHGPVEVRLPMEFTSDFGAVRMGVRVDFEKDLRISAVHLLWSGESQRIGIYPLSGDADPEPAPTSMDLAAGDQVLLEGNIAPRCGEAIGPLPTFVVRTAGRVHQRFVPSNTAELEHTVASWCAQGPTVRSGNVTSFPDGRYRVTLEVSNPGPQAAVVTLKSSAGARGSWNAAHLSARPGRTSELVVTGRGPKECRVDAPWKDGHLFVDGRPVRLPLEDWCG